MGTPVVLADRVLVATTTTGTGTYALGTAVTGYLDPAGAGVTSGARLAYVVVDSLTAPTAFEIGEGIYTAGSPGTLTRAQIRRNTAGGTSAINWGAGTKYLMLAPGSANLPTLDTDGALTVPALSLSGNAVVGGSLSVGTSASIANGLTVTAGGATVSAGNLTLSTGTLTVQAGGASVTGTTLLKGGDLTVQRATATQGIVWFGNASAAYLSWDSSNFTLQGGSLFKSTGHIYLSGGGALYANTIRDYSYGQDSGFSINASTIDIHADGHRGYFDSSANLVMFGNFVVSSDRRKKTHIRPYAGGAVAVDVVTPQRFERRDLPGIEQLGFVAQDLEGPLPEAVERLADDSLGLKEIPLIAALWDALRDTRARLRDVERRLSQMEATQ